MGVTINKKSTTTEPPPKNGQQPKPPGGLNAFYNAMLTLDRFGRLSETISVTPLKLSGIRERI